MRFFILILYVLIGYVVHAAYPIFHSPYVIRGKAQGTTYDIKYYASQEIISQSQVDSIFRVIDESMSLYKSNSLISKFNAAATKRIRLDSHMYNVVKASFKYHKITNGYFDITIFPLLKLWGFGPDGIRLNPTEAQIDSVKQTVGLKKLKLRGRNLIKHNQAVSIDLNGIAQGYTVDVLSQYFVRRGVKSFIIEVGGEIYTYGVKPNGDNYVIEIQRPYSQHEKSHKVVLQNKAITTSGSYEKFRMLDGRRISHHIDPTTGKPLINNTLSVTIIANTAMEADALDNYLMYLDPQSAISFIEKNTSCEAYIIYSENNTLKELQSSGFNNYIYKQQ